MTRVMNYTAHCPIDTCTKTIIIDESNRNVRESGDRLHVIDRRNGFDWPLELGSEPRQAAAMRRAGFVCPKHDTVMWVKANYHHTNTRNAGRNAPCGASPGSRPGR